MLITASVFASIIPMSVYLMIIWKMDKYEPEPIKFVFMHFLWGGFGAIILAILGSSIASWFIDYTFSLRDTSLVMAVISAPVIEEIVKAAYLSKTYKDDRFDNITDGLVYGGAIGLGFGMTENFFYFITYGDTFNEWLAIVSIRTAFSAVMHCITTGLVGAILGYVKFLPRKNKYKPVLRALLIAVLIHSMWNLSVSFNLTYKLGYLFMLGMIILFISIYAFSIRAEKKLIQAELAGEIPAKFIKFISTKGRVKKGWINESVRLSLIKNCTRLAFRKRQLRLIGEDDKISNEIERLRIKIEYQVLSSEPKE